MHIYIYSLYIGAIGGGEVYGDDQRDAVLKSVHCNGTEEDLLSCAFNASGVEVAEECGPLQDAHVVCQCKSPSNLLERYNEDIFFHNSQGNDPAKRNLSRQGPEGH